MCAASRIELTDWWSLNGSIRATRLSEIKQKRPQDPNLHSLWYSRCGSTNLFLIQMNAPYHVRIATLPIIKFTCNKKGATAVCQRHSEEQCWSKTNICTQSAFGITLRWKQESDYDQRLCSEWLFKCHVCTELGYHTHLHSGHNCKYEQRNTLTSHRLIAKTQTDTPAQLQ